MKGARKLASLIASVCTLLALTAAAAAQIGIPEPPPHPIVQRYLTLTELLEDAKQHSPLIVSNIKVIGGDRNAEFLATLADDQRAMGRFIEVMRHFTVIRKELRKEEGAR